MLWVVESLKLKKIHLLKIYQTSFVGTGTGTGTRFADLVMPLFLCIYLAYIYLAYSSFALVPMFRFVCPMYFFSQFWAFDLYSEKKNKKNFHKYNLLIAPRNEYNLKNRWLNRQKVDTPILEKSGNYQIDCQILKRHTFGHTKRNIGTRANEHARNIKNKGITKSQRLLNIFGEKNSPYT